MRLSPKPCRLSSPRRDKHRRRHYAPPAKPSRTGCPPAGRCRDTSGSVSSRVHRTGNTVAVPAITRTLTPSAVTYTGNIGAGDVAIPGGDHLAPRGQVQPELEAFHDAVLLLRHLGMDHAAAGGHPLHAAVLQQPFMAGAVAMAHAAGDHVGDGLEAAVRMVGKPGDIIVRDRRCGSRRATGTDRAAAASPASARGSVLRRHRRWSATPVTMRSIVRGCATGSSYGWPDHTANPGSGC